MPAPLFWHKPPGVLATLLSPVAAWNAAVTQRRLAGGPRVKMPVPVICVGDLTAGGTGKTPTVIALAGRLLDRGLSPHVVTNGDGGSLTGPVLVKERQHDASQTGDEALLLAAFLPTWVATDNAAGAKAATKAGADVILLDGGFQDASLAHDASVVIVDAVRGFGNGKVIPAGPLREPVAAGLARADAVLSIGPETQQALFSERWGEQIPVPHVQGHLRPLPTGLPLQGLPVVAFAGIGYPQKFFTTLAEMGADLRATHALNDHQPLTTALMNRMMLEAKGMGAQLVTTEKDAVRLPAKFRSQVMTVPVRLQIADWKPVDAVLDRVRRAAPGDQAADM